MRISSVEIINFRQYKELKLDFPKNGTHDLHVICADNGVGKTNILNAISWCLYGDEPHLGNASVSLPRLNLEAKRNAVESGNEQENVIVRVYVVDEEEKIIFERKQNFLVNNDFEMKDEFSVIVTVNGMDAVHKGEEEAKEYVNKYMPEKIRQYFYFDGEQLNSYFISDDSSKIKETIHAISQVDIVTVVKDRLNTIIAQKNAEAGKKQPQIDNINKTIADLEQRLKDTENKLIQINEQIKESERIIKENTEHLQGQENLPELEKKYQILQKQQEVLMQEKSGMAKKLFDFVRDRKVYLTFYPAAKETLDIIDEKRENNSLPPDIDKDLLQKILITHKCSICGHGLSEDETQNIRDMLDKIQVSSQTSNLLMLIRNELEHIVNKAEKYLHDKEQLLKEHNELNARIQECEQALQEIDDQISKFSDKEKVIQWHTERNSHKKIRDINLQKQGALGIQIGELKKQIAAEEAKRTKEFDKEKQLKQLKTERDFLKKSKDIVEAIESEMMTEVKNKMQERTKDYFLDLIWKKDVYTQIELDEKYQLDLIHKDGYSCVGSCSAAERSLLALAFTLALHEVSGFNALLFIDTPVARVTSQNRKNFAVVLEKVSETKQLIMTFTPDEYSENIKKVFEPIAATSARLKMNSYNEITTII